MEPHQNGFCCDFYVPLRHSVGLVSWFVIFLLFQKLSFISLMVLQNQFELRPARDTAKRREANQVRNCHINTKEREAREGYVMFCGCRLNLTILTWLC